MRPDANLLLSYSTAALVAELKRRETSPQRHPITPCDECANFRPGDDITKLCAFGHDMSFRCPRDWQEMSQPWGFYRVACRDRKRDALELTCQNGGE